MVKHDFPTPPPPTTTSLYSRRNYDEDESLAGSYSGGAGLRQEECANEGRKGKEAEKETQAVVHVSQTYL